MPEREECGKKARGEPESPAEEGCDELERSLVARTGSPAACAKAASFTQAPGTGTLALPGLWPEFRKRRYGGGAPSYISGV